MNLRLTDRNAENAAGSCALLEFNGRLYAGVKGRVLTEIGVDECRVSLRMERRFHDAYNMGEINHSNLLKLSSSLKNYFLRKEVEVLGLMNNATPFAIRKLLSL